MNKFVNQRFEYFSDMSSGKTFADHEFLNCQFVSCSFSSFDIMNFDDLDLVALRSKAKNIRFTNCEVTGMLGPGIVEDVTLENIKVTNYLQIDGAVFNRVKVKGRFNKLMVTQEVDLLGRFPNVQSQFDEANREYYKNVDWALDISEGLFNDCDIRGVPTKLIIRDKETQVVVKREKALDGKWKSLDLSETYWGTSIEHFLERGDDDCVLVAPKKSRKFKELLEGLNRLRDAGVAEPD
jgi:hypothetical protein